MRKRQRKKNRKKLLRRRVRVYFSINCTPFSEGCRRAIRAIDDFDQRAREVFGIPKEMMDSRESQGTSRVIRGNRASQIITDDMNSINEG